MTAAGQRVCGVPVRRKLHLQRIRQAAVLQERQAFPEPVQLQEKPVRKEQPPEQAGKAALMTQLERYVAAEPVLQGPQRLWKQREAAPQDVPAVR